MRKPDRAKSGQIFRCAIHTRKSSDDGLEQEFNSLDAQREACEAPPARPYPAQIAIDVEFSEIARRVARTARRVRGTPRKTHCRKVEPRDKSIDESNGILSANIIVNRFRQ